MSGIDFLLGLKVKDGVVLVANKTSFLHGIITVKHDHDKSFQLGTQCVMLCFGEGGDADQFGEYIAKNLDLYRLRNGYDLRPKMAAHFIRKTIAENLRTRDAQIVQCLVGGHTQAEGAYLAAIDPYGTKFEADYLAHGFGGNFCYSILDRTYKRDCTEDEGLDALRSCIAEVKKRFGMALAEFKAFVINKDGTRTIESFV